MPLESSSILRLHKSAFLRYSTELRQRFALGRILDGSDARCTRCNSVYGHRTASGVGNRPNLASQVWNAILDHVPDKLVIHPEVAVNEPGVCSWAIAAGAVDPEAYRMAP